MRQTEKLEQFWHNMVLTFPWAKELKGAVVIYYPEVPIPQFNHAADINAGENEVENLLNRITKYFMSKDSPEVRFRISPLTRPTSFSSFLQNHGFKKEDEESVLVFRKNHLEHKLNPEVKVREISEGEIDTYSELIVKIFEMSLDWKEGVDKFVLESMRKGAKLYLAYVDERPVGTSSLFSLGEASGIFNVGTLKEYRRCGIGTTLTAHALLDSIEEGNTLHLLHAGKSGNAERLYRKIGFEIDHTITWFVKKL